MKIDRYKEKADIPKIKTDDKRKLLKSPCMIAVSTWEPSGYKTLKFTCENGHELKSLSAMLYAYKKKHNGNFKIVQRGLEIYLTKDE